MAIQTVLWTWTEVCRQIFGGWEVQIMWNLQKNNFYKRKIFTNWLNMGSSLWAWVKKTVRGVETYSLISQGHSDSLLKHKKMGNSWFPWKEYN